MTDKTFHSELAALLDKYNIPEMNDTSAEMLADKIEQDIYTFNYLIKRRDEKRDKYIKIIESQLDEYKRIYGK